MKTYLQLSENRVGRVLLHLACISRRGRFQWHIRGIARELYLSKTTGG